MGIVILLLVVIVVLLGGGPFLLGLGGLVVAGWVVYAVLAVLFSGTGGESGGVVARDKSSKGVVDQAVADEANSVLVCLLLAIAGIWILFFFAG